MLPLCPAGSLILFDLLSNQKNGSPALFTPIVPAANGDTKQVTSVPSVTSVKKPHLPTRHCKSCLPHQVPESITAASPPAVEDEAKDDGEEFEDLSAVLEHLGLSEYKKTFDEERIDIESFVSSANTNAFKNRAFH